LDFSQRFFQWLTFHRTLLAHLRFQASLGFSVDGACVRLALFLRYSRFSTLLAIALRQPLAVILEVTIKLLNCPIGHDPEAVYSRPQQMAVMRYQQHAAAEFC